MRHYRDTSTLKFQVLEPRIMFDGAAVFTGAEALEQLENQNTSQIQNDIDQRPGKHDAKVSFSPTLNHEHLSCQMTYITNRDTPNKNLENS